MSYAYFVHHDLGLYDEENDIVATANNSSIGEELGQVARYFCCSNYNTDDRSPTFLLIRLGLSRRMSWNSTAVSYHMIHNAHPMETLGARCSILLPNRVLD